MSYFSRIQLDTAHPQARQALLQAGVGHAYREHQWLWQFFATEHQAPRDFLFRRIEPRDDQPGVVYTVSARAPLAPHPAWRVDSREYQPALAQGERLRFELRANPVRSIRPEGADPKRRSKRHDVVMHAKKHLIAAHSAGTWSKLGDAERPALYPLVHEAVADWLLGNADRPGVAARHGFILDAPSLQVDSYLQHRFPRGNKAPISLSTVDISGVLEVRDPLAFSNALLRGIGHAKAFGCGLLLARRAD
ncbi:type I-E CRISPR-associated protein Cas6/Cse3/CasE [Aquimonas sp.]|jgi:CRISPR system Cascade subunit CasE|uniref:type I-E CRISPR-associated protein Cas6/Cse3/CasE n=1 Tax=Aquimonas sp. TaxID=1872588 RepID=UPI0037BFD780